MLYQTPQRLGISKVFKATSDTKIHFDAAFFVKFGSFNTANNLSLRKLLIRSEYFPKQHMDDEVWNNLLENPEDVLVLFDGFEEFQRSENI